MAVLRLVSFCSAAGRRGIVEEMPTAVVWYGAMASNHTWLSSVVVRRIRGASPGETTWKMTGTAAGMTTSRGAWSLENENEQLEFEKFELQERNMRLGNELDAMRLEQTVAMQSAANAVLRAVAEPGAVGASSVGLVSVCGRPPGLQ